MSFVIVASVILAPLLILALPSRKVPVTDNCLQCENNPLSLDHPSDYICGECKWEMCGWD